MFEDLRRALFDFCGLDATTDFGEDVDIPFPAEHNFPDVGEESVEPVDATFLFFKESK